MSEIEDKGTVVDKKQPNGNINNNALLQMAQAINNMNNRISKLEITAMKTDANQEVFDKNLDLIHRTIKLLEKQIDKGG